MKYSNYKRNHATLPNREQALDEFLHSSTLIKGERVQHKLDHAVSSNSEDALTWSCFDRLRQQPLDKIIQALDEIFEDAYGEFHQANKPMPHPISFANEENIKIEIGKNYYGTTIQHGTEVDISIETDQKLIFFEAKLYGIISLECEKKPHDQIARKLRIGLDVAQETNREFYFIFLDIAPFQNILTYGDSKKESASRFLDYRNQPNNLQKILSEIPHQNYPEIAQNMGWLSWTSLFKTILRIS